MIKTCTYNLYQSISAGILLKSFDKIIQSQVLDETAKLQSLMHAIITKFTVIYSSFFKDHLKQTDQLCHHLAPVYHRSLRQQQTVTKTCAWSPDNSYFAWPSGGGKVELIPYDNLQDKM